MHRNTLIAVLAPSLAVAQPFSESMADCAALNQNAAQWVSTDEKADKLIYAANQWAEASLKQAKVEGRELTRDSLWTLIDQKTVAWEDRGAAFFLSQDFRDWAAYCRAFAKDRGVQVRR